MDKFRGRNWHFDERGFPVTSSLPTLPPTDIQRADGICFPKVPAPECVGEKGVKLGVRNREIHVRGNASLGNRRAPKPIVQAQARTSVLPDC